MFREMKDASPARQGKIPDNFLPVREGGKMKNNKVLQATIGLFIVLVLALPNQVAAENGVDNYSREQLTQMLAPVALYPDALLAQVLMAATYPLEVVEADRWVGRNPLLTGANLDEALRDKDWDASVKELCHVPTVLSLMSERLDETTNLGNAFLAQEDEVMDVIQELRNRAYREGNLRSDDKQKVVVQADGTILIAQADPQTIYVPYYNTRYVYGPWWYPDWPPWYWGPGYPVVGSSIYFWPDAYFGFGLGFGYWSYWDWPRHSIVINVKRRPRFFRHDYDWQSHGGSWRHEPKHRRGVGYRDRPTAEKFGQFRERHREFNREVRGFPERGKTGWKAPAGRSDRVRGPVTASGGQVSKPVDRTGREAKVGSPVRQRIERENNVTGTPGSRVRTRSERGDNSLNMPREPQRSRIEPAPARISPPVREQVAPRPQPNREMNRQMETSRERERATIFFGGENGREESRSSIRGQGSRESMQRREQPRGFSSGPGRGEERGEGRGRSRR